MNQEGVPRQVQPARATGRWLWLGLTLVIAWSVYLCWPMLVLTFRGVRELGVARTFEIYELLAQVGRYNKILNVQINGDRDDPFGPRIRRLEEQKARAPLSGDQEQELGNLYLRLGRFDDAVAALARSVDTGDARYSNLFDLALSYMRLGEIDNCAHSPTSNSCLLPVASLHTERRGTAPAAEMFQRALEESDTLEARWLLNLMHMLMGTHRENVPEKYRMDLQPSAEESLLPRFTDISRQAGVAKFGAGRGSVLGDFDGDGRTDIIAAGMWGPLSFFRNEGDGRFSDWTQRSGLSKVRNTFIVVAADYDNDGRLDLYATRLFLWGAFRNVLLHNEGEGRFRDVTDRAGVACPGASMSAAWADYDNDGFVDLYVTNISDAAPLPFGLNPISYIGRSPNALYHNNGDGTFTNVAERAGVGLVGLYLGAVWGDYDADGYADLYISQFFGPNVLFRNQGDGTFKSVAKEAGVEAPFCSFTSWFWDYDGDGDLDILSTAWAPLSDSIKGLVYGERNAIVSMQLYRNRSDGRFDNVTESAGLDRAHGTMAGNFGDIDNDGYPDFALGTGSPQVEYVQPNAVYYNNGKGKFTEVGAALRMSHLQKGHGFSFGDINDDGRVDIYLPLGGGYPGDSWFNVLYRNDGPTGHWLGVRLEGKKRGAQSQGSNLAAIGARIYLTAEGRTRTAEVTGGSGFGSSSLQQHFGLGSATRVDRLEVFWPASKTHQLFTNLPVDRVIYIGEFDSDYQVVGSTK